MGPRIRRVEYFYTTVKDRPGEAYELLSRLASGKVNLLAFGAVPMGPDRSQLTLFPESVEHLAGVAEQNGLTLEGPNSALLVQGDDQLGALVDVHARLYAAGVNIFASSGVTDGEGCYGYVLYVRPDEIARAAAALGSLIERAPVVRHIAAAG